MNYGKLILEFNTSGSETEKAVLYYDPVRLRSPMIITSVPSVPRLLCKGQVSDQATTVLSMEITTEECDHEPEYFVSVEDIDYVMSKNDIKVAYPSAIDQFSPSNH